MAFASSKRRSSEEDDFETLRQYILECPFLAGKTEENTAVKAAIAGLDHELKRRERDAKLQRKFESTGASSTTVTSVNKSKTKASSKIGIEDEWQSIDEDDDDDRKPLPASLINRQDFAEEEEDEVEIIDMHDDDVNFFGKKLAEAAIASIAESQTRAKTPIAAVALALHAALRSDIMGFSCMNSTDDGTTKASNNGFAAPIRELPKAQFLPKGWDKHAQVITGNKEQQQRVVLRYRKDGMSSVLLKVEIVDKMMDSAGGEETITVKLLPAITQEPPTRTLTFPLGRHVNLDSMTTALRSSSEGKLGVHPALHYKALPDLMTEFANTFDLGAIHDNDKPVGQESRPKFLTPPIHASCGLSLKQQSSNPPYDGSRPLTLGESKYGYNTPTIGSAFPPTRPQFIGDFSGDLVPGGMPGMQHIGPGNMMGPNHPFFQGGGMSGVGDSSGFGMRPRFDPFGPPGGPQEIPNGGSGGIPLNMRPRSSGDPNPDHLQPPNSFNTNNMFS
jgi:hypothetical protein